MDSTGAAGLKPGETVKGKVPVAEIDLDNETVSPVQLMPWQQSAHLGPAGASRPNPSVFAPDSAVPQHVFEKMQAGLPAPVRRTAQERYEVLVRRLLEMGRACSTPSGIHWPSSFRRILNSLGVKQEDMDLRGQVYALARHFIVRAENKQRDTDSRKTVLDYHGHYD